MRLNSPSPVPDLPQHQTNLPSSSSFGDALVDAELAHIVEAVGILNRVADVAILAGLGPLLAADLLDLGAVRFIDADAGIVRVADDQVAVFGDAQAARPAVAKIRSRERRADVIAIEVIRLNAGGEVDDPETIIVIDDRGPRPNEVAVEDAALAPDDVRLGRRPAAGDEPPSPRERPLRENDTRPIPV